MGSSPRVWGQVFSAIATIFAVGIIPTRMGTRSLFHSSPFSIRDHPHAYGDKLNFSPRLLIGIGSSPRVWGQESPLGMFADNYGIIPTRMGTRKWQLSTYRGNRDHPHAYGDKSNVPKISVILGGSSPRVWGQANVSVFTSG